MARTPKQIRQRNVTIRNKIQKFQRGGVSAAERQRIASMRQRIKANRETIQGLKTTEGTTPGLWEDYALPPELLPFVGIPWDSLSSAQKTQMNEILNTLPVDERAMAYNAIRGFDASTMSGNVPSAAWVEALGLHEGEIYQFGGFQGGNGLLPGGSQEGTSTIDQWMYYGSIRVEGGNAIYTPYAKGGKAITFEGAGLEGPRPGGPNDPNADFGDFAGGSGPSPGAFDNGDGTWTLRNGAIVDGSGNLIEHQGILEDLKEFLRSQELPDTLINFIQDALAQDKPTSQIIAEIRETPEYKLAYPENDMRRLNNLPWMAESEIRGYREEARRLSREYMGVDANNNEIASLIGRGVSLRNWERRLQINDAVERWGGAVQQVFEATTGSPLSNERLHAFFDPDHNTSDLDNMYEMALRRGQPTILGFATRPEDEAKLLQDMGIPVEQVFKNYQQIASELPRFTRLAAIGKYLETGGGDFFGDVSVSGSLLFRAVNLGDPEALKELQRRVSEENTRWVSGGGPQRTQSGAFSGLSAQ